MAKSKRKPVLTDRVAKLLLVLADFTEACAAEFGESDSEKSHCREVEEAAAWVKGLARWKLDGGKQDNTGGVQQ